MEGYTGMAAENTKFLRNFLIKPEENHKAEQFTSLI